MILVAGVTASVLIQTMNSLQERAIQTGAETIKDISSGLKVTHVSGYTNGSKITRLAIVITPITASDGLDLAFGYIFLSDSNKKVVLHYNSSCFSSSISNGLFNTLNSSNLSATTYGVMVVRDIDGSCSSTTPVINDGDLVVLLINATKCFSGIGTHTAVSGNVNPEYGISGVIGFTTPSTFADTIVDLQP